METKIFILILDFDLDFLEKDLFNGVHWILKNRYSEKLDFFTQEIFFDKDCDCYIYEHNPDAEYSVSFKGKTEVKNNELLYKFLGLHYDREYFKRDLDCKCKVYKKLCEKLAEQLNIVASYGLNLHRVLEFKIE